MKINNAILSFFWNHFDFFVRFGYCRLGLVSKLIKKVLVEAPIMSSNNAVQMRFKCGAESLKS
ncbi:MAG: hypothetical protein KAT65_02350 [Methanophagales archaeon]|nr:hypothetical protein [Methanophagales archaeon]